MGTVCPVTDVFDDESPRVTVEPGRADPATGSPEGTIDVSLAAGSGLESAQGVAPAGCLATCDQFNSVSGAEPSSGCCSCSGSGVRAARRLAELAALRLIDAPAAAEEQLRRALVVGGGELSGRELAVLRTQLVTAVAAQPGRDRDVARAAATAAECWQPISVADSVHLRLVAGRAWHRAGRHAEAVAEFDLPLLNIDIGYPPRELAQVRAEFAESLIRLGRYRQAAWQFTEAARLLAGSSADRHRHADLVWSAAVTRECCGQETEALGGYLRAAELWGDQDKVVPRSQCLRAAAWLQLRGEPNRVRGQWRVTVEALLAELDRCVTADPAAHLVEELERTRCQYSQMCEQASGVDEHEDAPLYADPLVWWESH